MTMASTNREGVGLDAKIWYLALVYGEAISSTVQARFMGNIDVIASAAYFQDVDQSTVFGTTQESVSTGGGVI